MTSFTIDTGDDYGGIGRGRIDYCQALQDAAQDSLPHDADQDEIDAALAKLIVSDLLKPKRADTARAHLLRYWPLIAPMAHTAPASFDFIIENFAERLGELR